MGVKDNYNNLVSIVIISYDPTAGYIQKTLSTLLKQTYTNFEIVLVDSGAKALSTQIVSSVCSKAVIPFTIVSYSQKKGTRFNYARAYNSGIRKAKGDIIVRLSGDAIPVGKSWLHSCVELLHEENVGIVSATDIIKNHLSLDRYLLSSLYERIKHISLQARKSVVYKNIPMPNGPCMIFWRILWQQHKFNENWLWGEEFEFTAWILRKGYFLMFNSKVRIQHSHRLSTLDTIARIKEDAVFAYKINRIFRDHIMISMRQMLKTTLEVPYAQLEKGRRYYAQNGSKKILFSYIKQLSRLTFLKGAQKHSS